MPVRDAVKYALDVTRAIEYAHSRGVMHRDLKPANVLITEQGKVVLTDFGLAKRIGSDDGLTATGAALGTPSYMSPEQASGNQDEQSPLTDVYAIGAILYALLVGKPPFQADSVMQTLMQVLHKPAPSVRSCRADVHPDLDTIVTKCLEKTPSRRYDSAKSLAEDLDRFYRGAPISARPPSVLETNETLGTEHTYLCRINRSSESGANACTALDSKWIDPILVPTFGGVDDRTHGLELLPRELIARFYCDCLGCTWRDVL